MLTSSLNGNGITEFWVTASEFFKTQLESGQLQKIRNEQLKVS